MRNFSKHINSERSISKNNKSKMKFPYLSILILYILKYSPISFFISFKTTGNNDDNSRKEAKITNLQIFTRRSQLRPNFSILRLEEY